MTKTQLISILIVLAISYVSAVILLSEVIRQRKTEYKKVKIVISIILAVYASFGIATLAEVYYSSDFILWQVALMGFTIFCIYFMIAGFWGLHKEKKDKEKEWECKIVNIADARAKKK